jgi:UDP-glucuronate decarboxylase
LTITLVQSLKGEDITIYGNGQQTRSFCYVDDLVDGIIGMMETGDEFTGPVNLGNPNEFTILELAEKVIKIIGSKSKIKFLPLPPDDPKQRQPDIALAREKLGWKPRTQLDEGLIRTIDYFKNIVSN